MSHSVQVRAGVPQGSVLGPVLFVICVDDLVRNLPSDVHASLYLAIWASGHDEKRSAQTVQLALCQLEEWSTIWRLCLNPAKCESSFFSKDHHQANFISQLNL